MSNRPKFLTNLLDWPEDGLAAGQDPTPYYQNWGFTIYRTCYKPSSDQKWEKLLGTIRTKTREQLTTLDGVTPENDELFQTIWLLFRLDARSDVALDGLDMDAVRQMYKNGVGGVPMNTSRLIQRRVFLLADEDVLDDVEEPGTVKCVEADYVAVDWTTLPNHRRAGPQRYFGWTRITTRSVFSLWQELETEDLESVALGMTAFGNTEWELLSWPWSFAIA